MIFALLFFLSMTCEGLRRVNSVSELGFQSIPLASPSQKNNARFHNMHQKLSTADSAPILPRKYDGEYRPALYTVFAGRKELMKMQEPFWVQMVELGAVKEVHLWDYTHNTMFYGSDSSKFQTHRDYLHELERKYKWVRVFTPEKVDPMGYTDYYRYYKDNPYEGVVIKADDDIVYVNASMVRNYVHYLEQHNDIFLLSASVVNQGLCAHYQQEHGAIDPAYETFPLPPNGMGPLHQNATQAFRLHKWFQEHPTAFFVPGDVVYDIPYTINTNFVALHGESMSEVFDLMMDQIPSGDRDDYYDEGAMTWDAIRKLGKKEQIYMGLVVAHMGYAAQRAHAVPVGYKQSVQLWKDYYHMDKTA